MRKGQRGTYQRMIRLLDSPSIIKRAAIGIGVSLVALLLAVISWVGTGSDMLDPEPAWMTASAAVVATGLYMSVLVLLFALFRRLFTRLIRPRLLAPFIRPPAPEAGTLSRRPLIIGAVYLKYRTNLALMCALVVAGAGGVSMILRGINGITASSAITLLGLIGIAPLADVLVATYRFKNGYFGDEREAREVASFILANSDNIDLDDNNFRIFDPEILRGSASPAWSPIPSGQGKPI